MHPDRSRLGHRPSLRPAKRPSQRRLGQQRRRTLREEPLKRCLPGLGVHTTVVNLLSPALEDPIEILQARRRAILELDQYLVPDGPEDPLDLPAPLQPCRCRMDQPDAEHRARTQQLTGHERWTRYQRRRPSARRAPRSPHATRERRSARPRGQASGSRPTAGCDRQGSRKKRAVTINQRAMQRIPGPQLVAMLSLKAPERPREHRCPSTADRPPSSAAGSSAPTARTPRPPR